MQGSISGAGMGLFKSLNDELMLRVLGMVRAQELGTLASTCKALYCFANHEELWIELTLQVHHFYPSHFSQDFTKTLGNVHKQDGKPETSLPDHIANAWPYLPRCPKAVPSSVGSLCVQQFEGGFSFKGTWKATYLSLVVPGYIPPRRPPLKVRDFYSDLLYQPYFCATVPLRDEWLGNNNVERRSGLSLEQFRAKYEKPNRPVIITDVVSPKVMGIHSPLGALGCRAVMGLTFPMPHSGGLTSCPSNGIKQRPTWSMAL